METFQIDLPDGTLLLISFRKIAEPLAPLDSPMDLPVPIHDFLAGVAELSKAAQHLKPYRP